MSRKEFETQDLETQDLETKTRKIIFENGETGQLQTIRMLSKINGKNVSAENILVFERRDNFLGQSNTLSARPLVLSGKERDFFIARGFGGHATSMVTAIYSKVGEFLAEAEKLYGVSPKKQSDGSFKLSPDDLAKLDANTRLKYNNFLKFQVTLKSYLEEERSIDPNFEADAGAFRNKLLALVDEFRDDIKRTPGSSKTFLHSDDILFETRKIVTDFNWPRDPDEHTRCVKITDKDQLGLGKAYSKDDRFLLDFSCACPGGMSEIQRDNLVHCVAAQKGLQEEIRTKLFKEVEEHIEPTRGIGYGAPARRTFTRVNPDDGILTRTAKNVVRGVYLLGRFALLDAPAALGSLIVDGVPALGRALIGSKDPTALDAHEDPAIDLHAKKTAKELLSKKKGFISNFNNKMTALATKTSYTPGELSALKRKILIHAMLDASQEQFELLKKDNAVFLSPFYTIEQVEKLRKLKAAHTAYEQAYQKAFSEALKEAQGSTLEEKIKAAKNAAEKKTDHERSNIDNIMRQLQPTAIVSEHEKGHDFKRVSVFGGLYEVVSAISSVIEDMGLRDPVKALPALGVMGMGIAYVATIAAAGHGSAALAAKTSKFVEMLNKSQVFPAFYHGVAPIHAGDGAIKTAFVSFADGLTIGKATYMAMSLTSSLAQNQEGFTTSLLSAVARNPVESAVIAAFLYGMGTEVMKVTGEAKDEGSWTPLDNIVAGGKPAAILVDLGLAVARALSSGANFEANGFNTNRANEKLTEMFFRGLSGDQELSEDNQTILKNAIRAVLEDPKIKKDNGFNIREQVFGKIDVSKQSEFLFLNASSSVETESPQATAATQMSGLSKLLYEAMAREFDEKTNAPIDESQYLECLAKAQVILQARGSEKLEDIVRVVMSERTLTLSGASTLVTALRESGFSRKALDFPSVNDSQGDLSFATLRVLVHRDSGAESTSKDDLSLRFIEDLLQSRDKKCSEGKKDLWKICNIPVHKPLVEAMIGRSLDSLQTAQPKQDTRSFVQKAADGAEAAGKVGVAVVKALSEAMIPGGVIRAGIGLTFGVVGAIVRGGMLTFGNPSHETLRAVEKYSGYDQLMGVVEGAVAVGRWIPRVASNALKTVVSATSRVVDFFGFHNASKALDSGVRAIEQGIRAAGDQTKVYGVKRPDDVPHYRISMAKVELVKPDPKTATVISLVSGFNKDTILSLYRRTETPRVFGGDTGMVKNLKAVENLFDNRTPTSLDMLTALFPWEAGEIRKLMAKEGVTNENDKNSYMLASLQRLFREEMNAAKKEDNNSDIKRFFSAITKETALLDTLSGQENYATSLNPSTGNSSSVSTQPTPRCKMIRPRNRKHHLRWRKRLLTLCSTRLQQLKLPKLPEKRIKKYSGYYKCV